jgi:hypothetical protein
MTIRLYCDEDSMRHALVVALRKRGEGPFIPLTWAISAAFTPSGFPNRGPTRELSWLSSSSSQSANR